MQTVALLLQLITARTQSSYLCATGPRASRLSITGQE